MNLQTRLDQFRNDNPYDIETQSKRLLAANDKDLILYVLGLGLVTAKQRQRHAERDYIKNVGTAPPRERLVPGKVTGAVNVIKIKPSQRIQNAMKELIVDVWRINGEQKLGDANAHDLSAAVKREIGSSNGHQKNAKFYRSLKDLLSEDGSDVVRTKCDEQVVRKKIEDVYGEFRKTEAA